MRSLTNELTLGRDPSCEIALADDSSVSRLHARFRRRRDQLSIEDLESRNGTFLNGVRVQEAVIEGPSIIRVGETLIWLGHPGEPWQAPTKGPLVGGRSLALLRRKLSLIAPSDLPILASGETGTGKDVVARLVHDTSGRSGPLVAVNCAALPESLAESELFGHVRNAFTGAAVAKKGLFSAADGGTLFLDEVGELPLSIQAKLLRVLEDKEVRPVGSTRSDKVDVRIIAASNRDLESECRAGRFRQDLLARLAGVELRLPPLRERVEDLPAIAGALLARAGSQSHMSANAVEALVLHDWPMNIRELDNVLRNASLSSQGAEISLDSLPEKIRVPIQSARAPGSDHRPATDQRDYIESALREHGGNIRQASRALNLSRTHVYRLLKKWKLEPSDFRKGERHGDCTSADQDGSSLHE